MRLHERAAWHMCIPLTLAVVALYAPGCATTSTAPAPGASVAAPRDPLCPAVAMALATAVQRATYSNELIINNGRNPRSDNYVDMRVPLDMHLGEMLSRQLTLSASKEQIPLICMEDSTRDADVLATITNVEIISVSGTLPPPTLRVKLECIVKCTDKNGVLLDTICFRGNGTHETIMGPLLATSGSLIKLLLFPESTAEPYGHAAFEKALAEVAEALVGILSDKTRVEALLIADASRASAHNITLRGAACLKEGNFLRAYLYCRRATERYPEYQPAACYLGAALAQLGEYAAARDTLRKAIAIDPQTQEAMEAGRWLESLEHAETDRDEAQ